MKKRKPKRRFEYVPIDWDAVDELGVLSDRELARKLRVTHQAVQRARKRRGIPPIESKFNPNNPK